MTSPDGARPTAVALRYADRRKAPVVVAKGYGATAESIMRIAREREVYVHESPQLVGLLMQVDLDAQIPPDLYQAVAEVMTWLARVDRRIAAAVGHDHAA
ncbi:EscU/YscU/HrcU family type III secretion system export apparatus switch protein [Ramlibacter sp.]|uniref:EscU/YscU/HrcU family type III secretion system export apparatus switch protein n=1 Tax=Ramlibacter sp. TaxID=1917967 RepID=UPI002BB038D2|nr:EscU/YscU/HrcU family type III secretion system export apparatus switch protein [Ramlibacter sp.]HWI83366.1 EscU/YscU/HrcU family type III secretion system export apparatus switch protein [Ramlibacter sp.]